MWICGPGGGLHLTASRLAAFVQFLFVRKADSQNMTARTWGRLKDEGSRCSVLNDGRARELDRDG